MYPNKTAVQSKKVMTAVTGILALLASQAIAGYFHTDPELVLKIIAALAVSHNGTQGLIDFRLAGQSALSQTISLTDGDFVQVKDSAVSTPPSYPLPVPNDTPPTLDKPAESNQMASPLPASMVQQ